MKYGKAKTTPQGTYCSRPRIVIVALIRREKIIQIQALPHSFPKTRHIFFPSRSHTASIIRTIQDYNPIFGLLHVTADVIKKWEPQRYICVTRMAFTTVTTFYNDECLRLLDSVNFSESFVRLLHFFTHFTSPFVVYRMIVYMPTVTTVSF